MPNTNNLFSSKRPSKRRKMKRFKITEISAVDNPAQKGAVATLFKRKESSMNDMQTLLHLKKRMRTLNAQIDNILKGKDLRNVERTAPFKEEMEYEIFPEGKGPEFEKEPDDIELEDELDIDKDEDEHDEDELDEDEFDWAAEKNALMGYDDDLEKERVYRPGRDASQHRGDWPPGSRDPGPGQRQRPPAGSRVDDYASPDERKKKPVEMTPERASQLLQQYANGGMEKDEDEELTAEDLLEVTNEAEKLSRRFPKAPLDQVSKAAASGMMDFRPAMGREREMLKRAQERQGRPMERYSDRELAQRLAGRFGKVQVTKHLAKYYR